MGTDDAARAAHQDGCVAGVSAKRERAQIGAGAERELNIRGRVRGNARVHEGITEFCWISTPSPLLKLFSVDAASRSRPDLEFTDTIELPLTFNMCAIEVSRQVRSHIYLPNQRCE